MTSAYLKVKQMNCSIRKTAREYRIPEATLRNRLNGRVDPELFRSGPSPLFSQEQEAMIANHLKFMSSVGYGYSRAEVIDIASEYANSLGYRDRDHPVSLQWYANFMSRWPELKVLKPRGLQIQRAKATSEDCVSNYFTELGSIITRYNLSDKPENIFNVDEKGLSTTHKPPNIITAIGTKPSSVTSSTRLNVTVIGCGSALGQQVPPYFIFPGERMRQELLEGKTPGTNGTVTKSGWSNSLVFKQYLESHLLKFLPARSKDSPVLLLYDGHRSHISLDLINWTKQKNIILFVLPAHTSHILQPMDVGCFGPFERIYNAVSHKFMRDNCGQSITKCNICPLACKADTNALSSANLQASFRKAGIYPFNPDVIDVSHFQPSTVLQQEQLNVTTSSSVDLPDSSTSHHVESEIEKSSEHRFFEAKECNIKQKKQSTKKRRYLSYVVSGKPITEDSIVQKINEHEKEVSKKPKLCKPTKSESKISKLKMSKPNHTNKSSEAGPSHYTVDTADKNQSSSDDESIAEEEKCCVCHMFTPTQVRESVYVEFTNWAQCDRYAHWVHLKYCTDTRVLRRGDVFLCPHCKE